MRRALTMAIVAASALWCAADSAEAFHHTVRVRCIAYYPGLYSYGFCGCAPCPPPPYTFPCTYRYPKFCGRYKTCWTGRLICSTCRGCAPCGYGCGYGCGGCGYGCGSCAAGCGGCGYGCGSCATGCGSSCGAGGCDSCNVGSASAGQSFEAGEKVLYDGPAAGAPSHDAPPEPQADPSASLLRGPFRLTSNAKSQADGSNDFARGLSAYWDGNATLALQSFDAAAAAEPQNALYHYYRALAFYQLQGADAAAEWLQRAVEIERQSPIAGWGKRMERVQGQPRLWIEQARSAAGVSR